jgi:hypothetical protein
VVRVDRIAIEADVTASSISRFAVLWHGSHKLCSLPVTNGPVTPVRHDVIHDIRRRHDSALQAELAQRMLGYGSLRSRCQREKFSHTCHECPQHADVTAERCLRANPGTRARSAIWGALDAILLRVDEEIE